MHHRTHHQHFRAAAVDFAPKISSDFSLAFCLWSWIEWDVEHRSIDHFRKLQLHLTAASLRRLALGFGFTRRRKSFKFERAFIDCTVLQFSEAMFNVYAMCSQTETNIAQ